MEEPRTDTIDPSLLSAAPLPVRLVVLAGPDFGLQLEVRDGTVLVGTHADCQLKLTDPGVSRRHLSLELTTTRVKVSDPSRTIVDLMFDPSLGGGLRSCVDMLENYLASTEHRDIALLMAHAKTLGVGTVFKRLGFLLERYAPEARKAIEQCARSVTKGYTPLDPALAGDKFVTAWRLSIPNIWQAQ